jgi:hypothetical protein
VDFDLDDTYSLNSRSKGTTRRGLGTRRSIRRMWLIRRSLLLHLDKYFQRIKPLHIESLGWRFD